MSPKKILARNAFSFGLGLINLAACQTSQDSAERTYENDSGEVVIKRYENVDVQAEVLEGHAAFGAKSPSPEGARDSLTASKRVSALGQLASLRETAATGSYSQVRALLRRMDVTSESRPVARLLDLLSAFALGERTGISGWLDDIREDFEKHRSMLPEKEVIEFLFAHAVVAGMTALETDEPARGMKALSEARDLLPEAEEPYLVLSSYFAKRGQYEAARHVLDEAASKVTRPSQELDLARARILRIYGDEGAERVALSRARHRSPMSLRIDQYEAIREFENRSQVDACARIRSLYEVNSAHPDLAFNHAFCLRAQGSIKIAESVLEKALVLFPERSDLRVLLTGVLVESGQTQEADRVWRRAFGGGGASPISKSSYFDEDARYRTSRSLLELLSRKARGGD